MNNDLPPAQVSRRAFSTLLLAGLGSVLVACAGPQAPVTRPVVTAPPVAPSPIPTSSATPIPVPTPTVIPVDPAEVAARFAGHVPQEWGMHMPGIIDTLTQPETADGRPRIALTLDACGGPNGSEYDGALIDGLVAAGVPATLFVNQRWLNANQGLANDLAAKPLFELANHGTRHVPLSVNGQAAYNIAGSASAQEVVDEVWGCHEQLLELTGKAPRFFRSGTAHYDDVAVAIVNELGEVPVGFSVNGDGGATFSADTVRGEVSRTLNGGIVIAHFNQPRSGTGPGMLDAVTTMLDNGVEFVHID